MAPLRSRRGRWRWATAGFAMKFVRQEPQLGTGHAVQQAVPLLHDDGIVLVLTATCP